MSCPTCGRTDPSLDILEIAQKVEEHVSSRYRNILEERGRHIAIAVMGCEVNGPGEARDADVGVAGGRGGSMLLFARGEIIKKIRKEQIIVELDAEILNFLES